MRQLKKILTIVFLFSLVALISALAYTNTISPLDAEEDEDIIGHCYGTYDPYNYTWYKNDAEYRSGTTLGVLTKNISTITDKEFYTGYVSGVGTMSPSPNSILELNNNSILLTFLAYTNLTAVGFGDYFASDLYFIICSDNMTSCEEIQVLDRHETYTELPEFFVSNPQSIQLDNGSILTRYLRTNYDLSTSEGLSLCDVTGENCVHHENTTYYPASFSHNIMFTDDTQENIAIFIVDENTEEEKALLCPVDTDLTNCEVKSWGNDSYVANLGNFINYTLIKKISEDRVGILYGAYDGMYFQILNKTLDQIAFYEIYDTPETRYSNFAQIEDEFGDIVAIAYQNITSGNTDFIRLNITSGTISGYKTLGSFEPRQMIAVYPQVGDGIFYGIRNASGGDGYGYILQTDVYGNYVYNTQYLANTSSSDIFIRDVFLTNYGQIIAVTSDYDASYSADFNNMAHISDKVYSNNSVFLYKDETTHGDSFIFSCDSTGSYVNSTEVSIASLIVNTQPSISYNNPTNLTFTISEPENQTFTINWTDSENSTILYYWYQNDTLKSSGETTDEQITYDFTGNYSSSNIYNITVIISDGEYNDSLNWTMTITDTEEPVEENETDDGETEENETTTETTYAGNPATTTTTDKLYIEVEDLDDTISIGDKIALDMTAKLEDQLIDITNFNAYILDENNDFVRDGELVRLSKGVYVINLDFKGFEEGDYVLFVEARQGTQRVEHTDFFKVERTVATTVSEISSGNYTTIGFVLGFGLILLSILALIFTLSSKK